MERDDPRPDSTDAVPAAPPADEVPTDLPIALGDLFQLLATDRTRQLLYFLTARGGTVFVEELEAAFDDEAMIGFHHVQFPRLIDFHIIDYDREAGAITLTPIGDDLRPVLELVREMDDPAIAAVPNRAER
ncbi:hypothetical protein Htur_1256 [Haloterrigena turkmenica DSM 5511]|uniref:Uncharacterized protein n=1 Tax=Haloterrigena turkmenica (strain ATCC 51198 / DSM 5511 / JCM 9101 / NCIMB 13204 / VKM B-1734 / 4k) TaxID=543526 RepID=D2RPB2_HALTV|nr:hypothetical protein [Haloterrigena turkmenica]ADB60146.1 hypothetical protein Htur_1256 [Haloterrigena turkmenica DSM 5511]